MVRVSNEKTIRQVREEVVNKEEERIMMRLIKDGKIMSDDDTMEKCGIKRGDVIRVTSGLPGDMKKSGQKDRNYRRSRARSQTRVGDEVETGGRKGKSW